MNNFTIYRVALLNKAKEEQNLNRFNGQNDLLELFNQYLNFLKKHKFDYFDSKGNKRVFSISSQIMFKKKERSLITYLDSAYTGEKFEIRSNLNTLNYSVEKNELQSRRMFSLIYLPENSKYGYIVFENKSKHGVKVVFESQFQSFLKQSGFQDYRIDMTPGLNFNYLSNMIEKGKLKKIRLIQHNLLKDVQLSLWGNFSLNSGVQDIREMKFETKTQNNSYKKELYNLFFSNIKQNSRILFMNEFEVDEISFEINHNNSSKTFLVKDKTSMRANIDVSKRLEYINGEPTYISMKKVAYDIIFEIIDNQSFDLDDVA